MRLKSIGVLSCAKVAGLLYGLMGLLFGALFSFFSVLGLAFSSAKGNSGEALLGLVFGVGAVVFLPIFYGVMGFITAAIGAALYNFIARMTGGIELELE